MEYILIVDDDPVSLLFMSSLLKRCGYQIISAKNGLEALTILTEKPQIQFVLSDWIMPEMDGIELCKKLKELEFDRYIFFVLLSGKDDKLSVINGINAGADDFIVKGTDVKELEARVKAGFRTLELHNKLTDKNQELDLAYATIRKDLDSAGDLIRQLLPTQTNFAGVELNYMSIPSAQIGGDMLGYMQLDPEHLAFYLFDVAGHGVSSALMSFSVQQSLSIIEGPSSIVKDINNQITPPEEVINKLNKLYISDDKIQLYFTMIYAVLNVKTGDMHYCSAGHPPLVWLHNDSKKAELIGHDNFVVGAFDFVDYQSSQIKLSPGDKIWVYSDGITEAENKQATKQFTENGLRKSIMDISSHPTHLQTELLVNRVRTWQESNTFEDDVSVLAVEWKGKFKQEDDSCNTKLTTKVNAQFFR
ncbi:MULTISPECIES: SpoIIE family protein phosphatase [unclassified Aliivibrio]|uniref:SpoIIE family protein phosphatase n=1 Tax=unclassified Aliivibrio TaxID=2645654 RepID=UPI00080D9DED|nr:MULTISPECIES: fused response regulator/phosphatase [unclassified Aliivibrio]OCH17418.1 regulator [Aliivibrio sp. 1S165]OCH23525.1 regulator [Aliivibrio sp. 1S128]OCH34411.1 regulator [Aliivibrio sp. 1S175]